MLISEFTHKRFAISVLATVMLAGCASAPKKPSAPPPVVTKPTPVKPKLTQASPPTYRVKAGETLYSISLRFDKDYRELARINDLDEKFTIYVDQQLRLDTVDADTPAPSTIASTKPVNVVNKPLVAKPLKNTKESISSTTARCS